MIEPTRHLGDPDPDFDGDVSLFGLDEFGMPVGLNPLWGGLAGGAISTGTAIAVRAFTAQDKWSEGIGAGVGTVAGAIMAIFRGSRAAGWTAIATSLATAGLRQLEVLLSGAEKGKQEQAAAQKEAGQTPGTHGWGIATVQPAMIPGQMQGAIEVQPLGISTVEPAMMPGQMQGAMPQLVGAQPQLLGLGLSDHYGATVFGR